MMQMAFGSMHLGLIFLFLGVVRCSFVLLSTYFGTKYAQAPEIWNGVPYTRSIDFWGLGVILYMLLMGQVVYTFLQSEYVHLFVVLACMNCQRQINDFVFLPAVLYFSLRFLILAGLPSWHNGL